MEFKVIETPFGTGSSSPTSGHDDDELNASMSLEKILTAIDRSLSDRLDSLASRVDDLDRQCVQLESKVERVSNSTKFHNREHNCLSVDLNNPNVVIERQGLNSIVDYPNGTWLGDENNPELRVRCQLTSLELLQIDSSSCKPEKMALMLMDYLFDRKTLACSSVAGGGPHNKQQLDPLKITGIKFHLQHKFDISADDWQRIKKHIDSKCRAAFRRKIKEISSRPTRNRFSVDDEVQEDPLRLSTMEMSNDNDNDDDQDPGAITLPNTQVIQTANGPIQVLHATAHQLAEMERSQQIRILSEEERQILQLGETIVDESCLQNI